MRLKVNYKGHEFFAIADFAGLDVEAVEEPTEDVMKIAGKLWNEIFETRISIFGEDVQEHDTTYGELQASLKELKLI